jgi:tRNA-specific 2-thiouridylase
MNSEAREISDALPANHVVVALSGGVDSSVAALLLARQGYPLVGVSMQVWDYRKNQQLGSCSIGTGTATANSKATCCSPADFNDARRIAHAIDIPYYVVDFEETFQREVIQNFVRTYQSGKTPNPCIDCNSKVKFRELRERAKSFGCSHVATGHYAQIKSDSDGFHLLRGRDVEKDQSYFLYTCRQDELKDTLFPVGHMTKSEVRAIAEEAGLVTAQKPESQDICFVAGSVQDFIVKISGKKGGRGDIVLTTGEKISEHDGIHRFTVGQRRGLNLGGSEEPLYVVEIDAVNNRVVVGPRAALQTEGFSVSECEFVNPKLIREVAAGVFPVVIPIVVQVRSRHRGVDAELKVLSPKEALVTWRNEWSTVSPGQAAVFYDTSNTEVLGGGRISV